MGAILVSLTVRLDHEFQPGCGKCGLATAARAFYARQDARTPLWTAIWTAGFFLILCFALTPRLGYRGVALANILAYSSEAVLLFALLRRRVVV